MNATTEGTEIDRATVAQFRDIRRYEAPQYLVEPLETEWQTPAEAFGPGGFEDTMIEVRVLDTQVMGWGPANAIVRMIDHYTGIESDALAVLHG